MKRLKKNSIGFNTISSTNGLVSARGVKSKPNDLQVFGFTHEVGEGEKSLDNPYTLQNLDNGAMTVDGVNYAHSIKLTNNDMSIRVPVPVALNCVEGVSDYIYKDSDGVWKLKQLCQVFNSDDYLNLISFVNTYNDGSIVYKLGNKLLESSAGQNIEFAKSNRVKVIPRDESENNICKIFVKEEDVFIYLRYILSTYPQFSNIDTLKSWLIDNPIQLIFVSVTKSDYILSDYAQSLLNSFILQNQNEIFIEGYPDIEISGYIQKW